MSSQAPVLLGGRADVERAVDAVRSAGSVGFDTEFMREKTYRARLCLIQLAAGNQIFVIDPLQEVDLEPVARLIADPGVEIIVHAGRQDFEVFHTMHGVVPARVFDVQLAAGFSGYGSSLPYGRLVEQVLGSKPPKGESYSDWCRRPLTDSQLRYAADDVRFLPDLARRLRARLRELQRLQWVEEEMAALESPELYRVSDAEMWRKVTGRGSLSGRQLAVLREVAAWRERVARARDLPRGWVLKDPTMIEIARRHPTDVRGLRSIRGFNAREAERSGRELLAAVQKGMDAEPVPVVSPPPRAAQERARMLAGVADAVVRARCEKAQIATDLVATRGELEALLAALVDGNMDEDRHRLMQGWRRGLAGDAVVALARGKIGVKVMDEPPYVQEIDLEGSG